jgi:site-specific DNA-cytosine methylase
MELKSLDEDTMFCSISTFSGGGIGDAGIEWGCKVPVISACELVPDRAGLIRHNYPGTHVFQGDIWELKQGIIDVLEWRWENSCFHGCRKAAKRRRTE